MTTDQRVDRFGGSGSSIGVKKAGAVDDTLTEEGIYRGKNWGPLSILQ